MTHPNRPLMRRPRNIDTDLVVVRMDGFVVLEIRTDGKPIADVVLTPKSAVRVAVRLVDIAEAIEPPKVFAGREPDPDGRKS